MLFLSNLRNYLFVLDCERNIDAVFMLDRSGSVGRRNHGITLNFIRTAVSFFTIGSEFTHVGVVAYSSSSSIQFDLDEYTTLSSLQNAISRVRYTGGGTNTAAALDNARFLLTPSNNRGARPTSVGVPKIAILITGNTEIKIAILITGNTEIKIAFVITGNTEIQITILITSKRNKNSYSYYR